ncbi:MULTISPECIES: DUF4333 domain-containing protein [Streptomyces]|uniref:DUF4333 domain-containing protein n=1 Tax=Streptomyces TaxID=1883 RepID=UPI000BF1823F|nr:MULTISPECIES: DUF4333 domain-containing protein [unclassified Streptomyces]
MTEQGKITRALMGLSAVVIAVCAVVVAVKVVGVHPQRPVLDQEAVERQVSATARSGSSAKVDMSREGVFCPTAIEARKGIKFECDVYLAPGEPTTVKAEVVDDQGKLRMSKS